MNFRRLLSELESIFFKIVFVQITTSELDAIPVFYIILTVPTYFPAYTVGIYIFSSLFIFCTFGHLIEETVELFAIHTWFTQYKVIIQNYFTYFDLLTEWHCWWFNEWNELVFNEFEWTENVLASIGNCSESMLLDYRWTCSTQLASMRSGMQSKCFKVLCLSDIMSCRLFSSINQYIIGSTSFVQCSKRSKLF